MTIDIDSPDGQQALLYCFKQIRPAGQQAENGSTVGPHEDCSDVSGQDPLSRMGHPGPTS